MFLTLIIRPLPKTISFGELLHRDGLKRVKPLVMNYIVTKIISLTVRVALTLGFKDKAVTPPVPLFATNHSISTALADCSSTSSYI